MCRYRVAAVLILGLCLGLFGQEDEGRREPAGARGRGTEEERAARRALFMQMMQERGAAGGFPRNVGATMSSQQPAPEGGEISTARTPAAGSDVTVNWENITLKDCIEVLCRDLGMEFVISPSVNVAQEVSVRAGDVTRWSKGDKLELFDAVLETAGVQKVQRGRIWIFAPSDIRPIVQAYGDREYSDGKPIIGVITLNNIDASQAEPFLNTVGGKPQRVFAMEGTRMILVLGTQQFLAQMEELVKLIDFPPGVMIPYVIENASSDDLVQELSSVFYGRAGGDGNAIRFISVPRLNTVVAHNVPESMKEEIDHWIQLLDRSDEENERVTKVYRLQVIESETMVETLDDLYSSLYKQAQAASKQQASSAKKSSSSSKSSSAAKKATGNNSKKTSSGSGKTTPTRTSSSKSKAPGSSPDMEEEAIILADKDTNTLIINATPDQHRDIERTIQELDKSRRQVLIETVLVEVTLDESYDLGIEWALSSAGLSVSADSLISSNPYFDSEGNNNEYSGLTYMFQSSAEKLAFIKAAEGDDRLQVLASPTVLTRDGMEAEVSFGQEVPIQEKTVSGTSTTKDNFSYNYMDAKITLTVTPVIDDNDMVTLNLVQTLRQLPPDYELVESSDSTVLPPIFTTRELTSNLQVENGQTLILGGLIERKDQQVKTGLPFFSDIPLIGWVFGRTQTVKIGSEIMMILTPHVVEGREETDLLTDHFRSKILGAMSVDNVRELYDLEKTGEHAETDGSVPAEEPAEGE